MVLHKNYSRKKANPQKAFVIAEWICPIIEMMNDMCDTMSYHKQAGYTIVQEHCC